MTATDLFCKYTTRVVSALGATVLAAGCVATETSSNPLSPSVAGPIPGVSITPPNPLNPGQGSKVAVGDQPITLTIENSTSSGVRPLSYTFELAHDVNFTNKILVREGIAAGENTTTFKLPDPLAAERSYYWRAKADDGANDSEYSIPVVFTVFTPVVIGKPVAKSPAGQLTSLPVVVTIGNAPRSGPVNSITYAIEAALSDSFASLVGTWLVVEQPGETKLTIPSGPLPPNVTVFWRVRGFDGDAIGPWSDTQVFKTPNIQPPPPAPEPPAGGGSISGAGDELDLSKVTWLHQNVSSWPITSKVTAVTISRSTICVNHTGAGRFPTSPFGDIFVEGNVWIFAQINGKWYGATWDWLRPGQECKGMTAEELGRDQIRRSPMDESWVPRKGDRVGFMMSSRARDGVPAGQMRSNVVMTTWPY